MLHNFAGNIEMYGVLDAVGSGPVEARISDNSTMASLIVLVLGFHSVYYCVPYIIIRRLPHFLILDILVLLGSLSNVAELLPMLLSNSISFF